MFLFLVKEFDMGTKSLARLYVGVCKADKIGRNEGSNILNGVTSTLSFFKHKTETLKKQ